MRLVTAAIEPGATTIRGILEIDLQPGWKTYWRDPGEAGVPPSLDIRPSGGIAHARIDFPAPERHEDASGSWAGYSRSVSLPVTFTLAEPGTSGMIEADVFLGLCRQICVPVQARLALDPHAPEEDEDRASVAMAFRHLPAVESEAFRAKAVGWQPGVVEVALDLPEGAVPQDLFLSGAEHALSFGKPQITQAGPKWTARVPTDAKAPPRDIPYTLVSSEGAVSGTLSVP